MSTTGENTIDLTAAASSPNPTPTSSTSKPPVANQKKKGGKPTSMVWDHFTKLEDKQKASCNYCKAEFASKSSIHGTSTLHNHLKRCNRYPRNIDTKQKTLEGSIKQETDGIVSKTLATYNFDQEFCRRACARMIIIDELPFRHVEHEGFRYFCNALQPRFKVPSRFTVARDCFDIYVSEKNKLKQYLTKTSQRVCLTTDTWSSRQNLSYMCLTAHFIDNDWKLHKRILNFCPISSHSGEVIGKAIERCLLDWGIDKVFTITVDNASSNHVGIKYLKRRLNNWNKSVLDSEFLHMRCCAHILNLTAKEGLKEVDDSIFRIRSAVKYVRSSPARLQKFKACVEQEKIESKSLVCLDVETRWNSTYLMLESALKFQRAFERLEEHDSKFRDELRARFRVESEDGDEDEPRARGEKMRGVPTEEDWDHARVLLPFLKAFYHATLKVSGSLYVTSNSYFHEVFNIGLMISEWCKSNDLSLSSMAYRMKTKHDKYWANIKNINMMLFIATVLDPRYKIEYVEWVVGETYSASVAGELLSKIRATLLSLFEHYSSLDANSSHLPNRNSQDSSNMDVDEVIAKDTLSLIKAKYKRHKALEQSPETKSELDRYLGDACEVVEDEEEFDICNWWKVNSIRYRALALMARDVLAIPVSTVASESSFSTGGRVLDPFRSSLTPRLVEALICGQNWLRAENVPVDIEEKFEELEKLEEDLAQLKTGSIFIIDD